MRIERQKIVQRAAERLHKMDGATLVVTVAFFGDPADDDRSETYVGAWVPDTDILRELLAAVLKSLSSGKATIIDTRRS